jgi:hypothetical protein
MSAGFRSRGNLPPVSEAAMLVTCAIRSLTDQSGHAGTRASSCSGDKSRTILIIDARVSA